MNSATIGSIVGIAFGCAWGVAGSTALPRQYQLSGVIMSITISILLIVGLLIHPGTHQQGRFDGRLYGFAVVFEVLAIAGTVFGLHRLNLQAFLMPAIGFIVGLHFIGLWRATELRVFLWIAVGMCGICVIALFLPGRIASDADVRNAVTGFGSALVLWTAASLTLFR